MTDRGGEVKKYNAEQYYDAMEWMRERAELIDGELEYMSSPDIAHQKILLRLASELDAIAEEKNKGLVVISADVKLDDSNIVVPDIFLVADEELLDARKYNGAPLLVVEIAGSKRTEDYIKKLALYESFGVREYWIVDPATRKTTVYFFEAECFMNSYSFDELTPINVFGTGFAIKLAEIL